MLKTGFEEVVCCVCETAGGEVLRPSIRTVLNVDEIAAEFRSSADAPLVDRLLKCNTCGCLYVSPRVEHSIALAGYSDTPDEIFAGEDLWRVRTFEKALKNILSRTNALSIRSVFDIGAGSGAFLRACKDAGLSVNGCEPNVWLTRWARQKHSIEILPLPFDELAMSKTFDLVSLWDVIEHISDPNATLTKAKSILKPGGVLVVNYPDYTAFPARSLGRRWPFWLTAHYWYFTEQTMSRLLEKHGLRVRSIHRFWQTLSLRYVLSRGVNLFIPNSISARVCRLIPSSLPFQYYLGQKMVIAQMD